MAERKTASSKKLDPAQPPRAMYGAELRHQRERAGLSRAELGEKLYVGHSPIAKTESGERRIQPDTAEQLDRVLDPGDFPVRDSKDPEGPALAFTPAAWTAFVDATARGEFPTP